MNTTTCPHCGVEEGAPCDGVKLFLCDTYIPTGRKPIQSTLCRERAAHTETRKELAALKREMVMHIENDNKHRQWWKESTDAHAATKAELVRTQEDLGAENAKVDKLERQLTEMTAIAEELAKAGDHDQACVAWFKTGSCFCGWDAALSRLEAARKEVKP